MDIRAVGTVRHRGTCPPKFFERTKSSQTNVAVANLTSKAPFVFPKHIYVFPLTQASYAVNSIFNI